MARYVNQIRYYGEKHPSSNTNMQELTSGAAFFNTLPIVQLGVQSIPGTMVVINNHTNPIIVGQTGIYELNVDGISYITDLKISGNALETINKSNGRLFLIIDYVYERE